MNLNSTPVELRSERDLRFARLFIEESGYFLLNLFSSKGFGKSTFLKNLAKEYAERIPTAYANIGDYHSTPTQGLYRLDKLLHSIVEQWGRSLGWGGPSAANSTGGVPVLATHIVALVELASNQGIVPLLLLDDYDQMPFGSRTAFEDRVLNKILTRPHRAKIVLSSGLELRFIDRPDLRIRSQSHELNLLEKEDIEHYLDRSDQRRALAQPILRYTGGVPKLVQFVIRRVDQSGIEDLEEYDQQKEIILGKEYRDEIRDVVLQGVEPKTDAILNILALLRRFDIATLEAILPKLNPELFKEYRQKDYLNLIHSLGDRVYWRDQGGYALNDILKGMLTSYLKVFEPETCREVNQRAVEAYEAWLQEEEEEPRPEDLLELIYHQTMAWKGQGDKDDVVRAMVSDRLLEFIDKVRLADSRDYVTLDTLRNLLKLDQDLGPYVRPKVNDTLEEILTKEKGNLPV